MMTKIVAVGLLIFLVLFVAVSFILPSEIKISKAVNIDAPPDYVFEEIDHLEEWPHWFYWISSDPYADVEFGEPNSGMEANLDWQSERSQGRLVINQRFQDSLIGTRIEVNEYGTVSKHFAIKQDSLSTRLSIDFDLPDEDRGFFKGWARLLQRFRISSAIKYELKRLKALAEAKPKFPDQLTEESLAPAYYMCITRAIPAGDPGEVFSNIREMHADLINRIRGSNLSTTGNPFCLFANTTGNQQVTLKYAFPISPDTRVPSFAQVEQLYSGAAIKDVHEGPYALIHQTYDEVARYIDFRGYTPNGAPWEVFITDPSDMGGSEEGRVIVYYPVTK